MKMAAEPHSLALSVHIPAAARGDRDAFAVLVNETRSLVCSIALAIVRDFDLSRDVAQDVFLAAWRDLGQLRDANSFLPWLRQLTRNRAYHVLRSERRRTKRIGDQQLDAIAEVAIDPHPHAGDMMLADEEQRIVTAVLDELPEDAREVVVLYYREGQSTAHVASLLGLSEAAVRQRLSRARSTMREALLDRFGTAASRSRPDARFTAAVLAALTVGTPAVSSAATVAAVSSSAPWLMKLLAAGGGATAGAAGGIGSMLFVARRLRQQARSAAELRAIGRLQFGGIALMLLTAVMFPLAWQLTHSLWSQVAVFAMFNLGLVVLLRVWLPRVVRDRHALEAIEDPIGAARARAGERRWGIVGWGLGLTLGAIGILIAWLTR